MSAFPSSQHWSRQIQCTHSLLQQTGASPEYLFLSLISPGNVAWMHVLAARNLQLKPDLLARQVYYSYDDTPTRKGFLIRHQLLSSIDPSVRLGSHIPYWKMWLMIQLHRIIKVILYPFWKPQPFLNLPLLNTIVTTFSYETDKASRHFGYKPLFTGKESKHRTAQWLKAATGNMEPPQLHDRRTKQHVWGKERAYQTSKFHLNFTTCTDLWQKFCKRWEILIQKQRKSKTLRLQIYTLVMPTTQLF